MGENGGLGVVGGRKILFRAVPHHGAEARAQSLVRSLEDVTGSREPLGQVLAHSDVLGPLTREKQPYHWSTAEAQVKPAPKATIMM